jgi:molybdopterin/thiamine biosynthesis adenylyltransferase
MKYKILIIIFFAGALQALEAIKLIIGHTKDKLLVERLLLFDGEDMTFRTGECIAK